MPSLLDLPREVRDLIIEDVLSAHVYRMPPVAPSKSNREDFIDFDHRAWLHRRGAIYHDQHDTHISTLNSQVSLLLTNRQISAETQSMINSLRSRPYILDLSVQNEVDLYPTWLQVPLVTNCVSTLYVNVRLFGHILSQKDASHFSGNGGLPGLHWSFYGLLERFLQYGPAGKKPHGPKMIFHGNIRNVSEGNEPEDRNMTVQTLILNFESAESELPFPPRNIDYNWWEGRRTYFAWYTEDSSERIPREKYTTRPEWLATFLATEIGGLLSMGYHTAEYGMILYESIGAIRILVDGKLTYEFDIASRLANLRKSDPENCGYVASTIISEERIPLFWKWKKQTLERRKQLGLPVKWPRDPELRERTYNHRNPFFATSMAYIYSTFALGKNIFTIAKSITYHPKVLLGYLKVPKTLTNKKNTEDSRDS